MKTEITELIDLPRGMFGGKDSEQYEPIACALTVAAGGWDEIYNFVEKTPRASLIVGITDALLSLGYKITKL